MEKSRATPADDTLVVVLSGASRGLGWALAERLLAAGHTVCGFSRSSSDQVETALADRDTARRFMFSTLDLSDADAVHAYAKRVVERHGRIDALINNAAIAVDGLLTLTPQRTVDQVLGINLAGTLAITRSCLRHMLTRRRGTVINVSSIIGLRGYSGLSVYAATKGALDATTRALAREVGPAGVTINSVAPGYLATEMSHGLGPRQMQQIVNRTPLGRLGKVGDVVPVIEFLLSPGARFITGQTIVVDGGITV